MKIKKIISVLLLIITAVMLVSCKNDPQIMGDLSVDDNYYQGIIKYRYTDQSGNQVERYVKGAEIRISTETYFKSTYSDNNGYFSFRRDLFQDKKYNLTVFTDFFPDIVEEIYPVRENGIKELYIDDDVYEFYKGAILGKVIINDKTASDIKVTAGIQNIYTDKNGFFKFTNLSAGTYVLATDITGFINNSKKIELGEDVISVNNVLEVSKNKMNISGKVLDANLNETLEGVTVQASLQSEYFFYNEEAVSDSEGLFEFKDIVSGTYLFTFSKDGFFVKSMNIDISEEDQLNDLNGVELISGSSSILINLVDASTGKPVQGVKLNIDDSTKTYVSDISGKINVYGLSKNVHTFVYTSDYYNIFEKSITIESDFVTDTHELVSKYNAGTIKGKVYTMEDNVLKELHISDDNRELNNFVLSYYDGQYMRPAPFVAVRGESSNEYIFNNVGSGKYSFYPLYIVDENTETTERGSGVYEMESKLVEIIINTGEELEYNIILNKNTDL